MCFLIYMKIRFLIFWELYSDRRITEKAGLMSSSDSRLNPVTTLCLQQDLYYKQQKPILISTDKEFTGSLSEPWDSVTGKTARPPRERNTVSPLHLLTPNALWSLIFSRNEHHSLASLETGFSVYLSA